MKSLFAGIFVFMFYSSVYSQTDSTEFVKYTPDFKFKEGFYLSFDQVSKNAPLPKSRILSDIDYSDPDFFEKILVKDRLYYYDGIGGKHELRTKSIWGYSRNGFLYIKMEDSFYRITQIGSISHFVASHTSYTSNYYSPYYNSNYYRDPYRQYPGPQQSTGIQQYLLDFINGRVLDYTEKSMGILLMPDSELYDEYNSLSRRKRKQMRFIYIRKFNEKHALYFPKN